MSHHPAVDLLELVLYRLPALPDARCRGRSELFDSEDPNDIAAAVSVCQHCPALAACRAWSEQLDRRHRPPGVVGGRYYRPRQPVS